MSFAQATDRSALIQSYDDWLAKVGVSVPKLRPDQAAAPAAPTPPVTAADYQKELAEAEPILKPVDAEAAQPRPFVAAAMQKCAYLDTAKKLATADAAQDYATALLLLREKKAKAADIQPALDYIDDPDAKEYSDDILRADLCLKTSSSTDLFKQQRIPYDAALAKQAAAEAALDFKAAKAARKEAGTLGFSIHSDYQHMFEAERLAPLVARCEKLIADDTAGRIPDTRRDGLTNLAASFNKCRTTGDYSGWVNDSVGLIGLAATNFLKEFSGQSADDWWNAGMTSPSGMKKVFGRALGRSQGSKDPALKGLSETKKLAAIGSSTSLTPQQVEDATKGGFRTLNAAGLTWDVSPVELAGLYAYTTENYKQMNALLRDQASGTPTSVPKGTDVLVAAAREGLAKLPPYDPAGFPLFRFEKIYADHLEKRFKPGTTFQVAEFWSAGAARGADITGGSDAEIVIWGKKVSGAKNVGPISAVPSEGKKGTPLKGQGQGEVLFPPGSKFKTVIRKDLGAGGQLAKLRGSKGLRYRIEVVEV
jgi:hypothetical protein